MFDFQYSTHFPKLNVFGIQSYSELNILDIWSNLTIRLTLPFILRGEVHGRELQGPCLRSGQLGAEPALVKGEGL